MSAAGSSERVWIGADPGGQGKFGVALLGGDGVPVGRLVDCVDEAVDWVVGDLNGRSVGGVGVDAPLWWSSSISGLRRADDWIRRTHGIHHRTVQASNSLRGAALVQGPMFVMRIRERLGMVPVTESHPKALLLALGANGVGAFSQLYGVATRHLGGEEDVRDAAIAAVCAREGFSGRWLIDLSRERWASEQDPSRHWLGPVSYFWPRL